MEIVKIIGIGLASLFIVLVLKEYKKEYAFLASCVCGIIILLYSMGTLQNIINFIQEISKKSYYNEFILLILKITGISILAEYAISICKDAGESAIANKVDFGGKILIISLSIPVIETTLESLIKILP